MDEKELTEIKTIAETIKDGLEEVINKFVDNLIIEKNIPNTLEWRNKIYQLISDEVWNC